MKPSRPQKKYYENAMKAAMIKETNLVLKEIKVKASKDASDENYKEIARVAEEMDRRLRSAAERVLLRVGSVYSSYGAVRGSLRKAMPAAGMLPLVGAIRAYTGVLLGGSGPYEEAVEIMTRQRPFWDKAFSGFSQAMSDKFTKIVEQAYKSPNRMTLHDVKLKDGTVFPGIVDEMRRTSASMSYKLYSIARTEVSAVSNAALEYGYRTMDPGGVSRYDWDITEDIRTTDCCKDIAKRVRKEGRGRGVSLDQLAIIVEEEGRKFMGPGWVQRRWVPHPQCRSAPELVK